MQPWELMCSKAKKVQSPLQKPECAHAVTVCDRVADCIGHCDDVLLTGSARWRHDHVRAFELESDADGMLVGQSGFPAWSRRRQASSSRAK